MENTDVNPEAETASKKPSKVKAIFAAVVAVALVVGGVYFFVFGQSEEGPPTLGAADQSLYQGLIQTGQYDFLSFDEEDVAGWENPDPEGNALRLEYENSKEGLHYVASSTETTLQQILDSMNPSETQGELMIAIYDDGFSMSPNDFYVAGEGVPLTIVPVEDMQTVTIEPNRFIILASDKDIELWGNFYTMESLLENFDFCNQEIAGWFPGAFSGNVADEFKVDVDGVSIDCMPDQLWALNENTFEFEEQDLASLATLDTFIWAYYEVAPSDSIAARLIELAELESEEVEEPPVEEPPVEEPPVEEPPVEEPPVEEPTGPAPITDLALLGATSTSITLGWTGSKDDLQYLYDVRLSLNSITEENWEEARQIIDNKPEAEQTTVEGIQMVMTVSSLSPGTSYYFAVKISDKAENESDISNVYRASTTEEEPPAEELKEPEMTFELQPLEAQILEPEESEMIFELQPLEIQTPEPAQLSAIEIVDDFPGNPWENFSGEFYGSSLISSQGRGILAFRVDVTGNTGWFEIAELIVDYSGCTGSGEWLLLEAIYDEQTGDYSDVQLAVDEDKNGSFLYIEFTPSPPRIYGGESKYFIVYHENLACSAGSETTAGLANITIRNDLGANVSASITGQAINTTIDWVLH